MTEQEYIADTAASKTRYWPSVDACRWIAAHADGISADTDAKYPHLHISVNDVSA